MNKFPVSIIPLARAAILALVGLLALRAPAVDRITATVSVTNAAGTTNGQTITVNGVVRTWTNNVVVASQQILTNNTPAGAKTNLYNQVALNPFSQVIELDRTSTNLDLAGVSGLAMTVTLSAGWGTVSYSTQSVTALIGVRVPIAGEASGGQATNIGSLLVKGINDLSTNAFYENAIAVQNLLGNTNTQTVVGIKFFTNAVGQWFGIVSNSPAISGVLSRLTNGVGWSNIFNGPISTNPIAYGLDARGAGSGSVAVGQSANAANDSSIAIGPSAAATFEQGVAIGGAASATGVGAIAVGSSAAASTDTATAIGAGAVASGGSATALGSSSTASNLNSTAIGYGAATTRNNQIMLGTATVDATVNNRLEVGGSFIGTNKFAGQVEFPRFALTSLANGINQDIVVTTNTFVEVSGPSGAFSIEGVAGGHDGKLLILLNQTGQNMTIATEGGATGNDPTAANRIISLSGADRATTGNGAAVLIYSGAASRWILLSFDP